MIQNVYLVLKVTKWILGLLAREFNFNSYVCRYIKNVMNTYSIRVYLKVKKLMGNNDCFKATDFAFKTFNFIEGID